MRNQLPELIMKDEIACLCMHVGHFEIIFSSALFLSLISQLVYHYSNRLQIPGKKSCKCPFGPLWSQAVCTGKVPCLPPWGLTCTRRTEQGEAGTMWCEGTSEGTWLCMAGRRPSQKRAVFYLEISALGRMRLKQRAESSAVRRVNYLC